MRMYPAFVPDEENVNDDGNSGMAFTHSSNERNPGSIVSLTVFSTI